MEGFVPASAGTLKHARRLSAREEAVFPDASRRLKSRRRPSRVAGFPSGPRSGRPGSGVGGWACVVGPRGARLGLFPGTGGFPRVVADEAGIPQRVSGEMEDIDGCRAEASPPEVSRRVVSTRKEVSK